MCTELVDDRPEVGQGARTWPRRKFSVVWSKKNSRYSARDQDKVITKQESGRLACPSMTEPKYAQSTCACSAGKTCNRRKAWWGCGRKRATTRRNCSTLPA